MLAKTINENGSGLSLAPKKKARFEIANIDIENIFICSFISYSNARGKPRRSEAEGTNSEAVGVGLTKQLGW